ncbi:MAG: S1C family serine protease, partial [Nitrososphaerales archaeon]
MKTVVVAGIIIAIVAGTYFYSTFIQNQPEMITTPKPPLTQTNGNSIAPQGEVTLVKPSETELSLPELFKRVENSVVQITVRAGDPRFFEDERLGSGFAYNVNGHMITNNHVIEGASKISVTFLDGTVYRAEVVGADPYTDLAVIRVDAPKEKLAPLPLGDSSKLQVGQHVAAIGNPFGLSGSMTTGIISQLHRLLPLQQVGGFSIPDVIQTDAAINPGNSGGPLLDLRGEVVGVNSAITSFTGEFSGVGFAIPSNTVKKIVPVLISDATYRHPWLGVSGTDMTPEIAEELNLKETKGFLVIDVVAEGPADKHDIRGGGKQVTLDGRQIRLGGDVIVAVDDLPVRKIDDILVYIQREKSVGDEMIIGVIRDGAPMRITVVLGERPSLSESP